MRESQPTPLAESLTPLAGQISVGCLAGAASGHALKVLGRAAALCFGSLFCGLQAASYAGFVQVDWSRVQAAARRQLATDSSSLDTLSLDDAPRAAARLQDVLEYNLPSGTGFSAGLAYSLGGKFGRLAAVSVGAPLAASFAGAHAFAASDSVRRQLHELAPGLARRLEAALLLLPAPLTTLEQVSRESERLRRAEKQLSSSKNDPAALRRLIQQRQSLEVRRRQLLAEAGAGRRTSWW